MTTSLVRKQFPTSVPGLLASSGTAAGRPAQGFLAPRRRPDSLSFPRVGRSAGQTLAAMLAALGLTDRTAAIAYSGARFGAGAHREAGYSNDVGGTDDDGGLF